MDSSLFVQRGEIERQAARLEVLQECEPDGLPGFSNVFGRCVVYCDNQGLVGVLRESRPSDLDAPSLSEVGIRAVDKDTPLTRHSGLNEVARQLVQDGAVVLDWICSQTTHVLTATRGPLFTGILRALGRLRENRFHVVGPEWVTASLECGALADELEYSMIQSTQED